MTGLTEDVRLMKEAGYLRSYAWANQPGACSSRGGEFEFEWMDRILDGLHEAGINVDPGYTNLFDTGLVMAQTSGGSVDYEEGRKANYGIRQNMDITNPTFLFYAERIIRKMMEHYATHPAIIGYQVDNETTSYGVNNDDFSQLCKLPEKEIRTTVENSE